MILVIWCDKLGGVVGVEEGSVHGLQAGIIRYVQKKKKKKKKIYNLNLLNHDFSCLVWQTRWCCRCWGGRRPRAPGRNYYVQKKKKKKKKKIYNLNQLNHDFSCLVWQTRWCCRCWGGRRPRAPGRRGRWKPSGTSRRCSGCGRGACRAGTAPAPPRWNPSCRSHTCTTNHST